MCGIVGFWSRNALGPEEAGGRVRRMRDSFPYRGPDEAGLWLDGPRAFGHRRLSILDLSPAGHQPMSSEDGRWTICYNGEVFNFGELRQDLLSRGHVFRGHSDTEVMLAAFSEWGLAAAVERFVGMFAFAAWDAAEGKLYLVRDRLGIKPLFAGHTPSGDLLFASELKAVMAYPGFERRIDPEAAATFLRYSYVPSPSSIFAGVIKLPPGHLLAIESPNAPLRPTPYWSLEDVARSGRSDPFRGSVQEAEQALHALLRTAVGLRMIADVPLGAFLSGGIDSSLVVALMQAQSARPIRTFTIGFAEARYDESAHARAVAAHLGTDHTEHQVMPEEALAVVPSLAEFYDEPMADVSEIPTYLVSALARRDVTVALSGDGGDELFGGYERYRFAPRAWRMVRLLPQWARRRAAPLLRSAVAVRTARRLGTARQTRKLSNLLEAQSQEGLYLGLISLEAEPLRFTTFGHECDDRLQRLLRSESADARVERMMLADAAVYLPDDLLTKLDRASMAVSLEGRVPILDHRVVEFAWRLPVAMRSRKRLLRRVLAQYVPRELFERPKMGFEVPIGSWLRGPLREWAHDILDAKSVQEGGLLDARAVAGLLSEHTAGTGDSGHFLWAALVLETWRRRWRASL